MILYTRTQVLPYVGVKGSSRVLKNPGVWRLRIYGAVSGRHNRSLRIYERASAGYPTLSGRGQCAPHS
jgi:hypothetical protein